MIIFKDISNEKPYKKFVKLYKKAEEMNEPCINIICLSTFDPQNNQVNDQYFQNHSKKLKFYLFFQYHLF